MGKRRGHLAVSQEDAALIATAYFGSLDLRGWRYEVVEVKRVASDPERWTIVVDSFSPEGTLVDGPLIYLIDGTTGAMQTLESLFEHTPLP